MMERCMAEALMVNHLFILALIINVTHNLITIVLYGLRSAGDGKMLPRSGNNGDFRLATEYSNKSEELDEGHFLLIPAAKNFDCCWVS